MLGHVEARGFAVVAETLSRALEHGEPILLALEPAPSTQHSLDADALPQKLRSVEVSSGRAADYDMLLAGGGVA